MELETAANGPLTASTNWSEEVEDLVSAGDVAGAISLLESLVRRLDSLNPPDRRPSTSLQLSSALTELSRLYASQGFSLKSDEVASRAAVIKHRVLLDFPPRDALIGQHTKVEDEDGVVSISLAGDSVLPSTEGRFQESKGLLTGDGVDSACKEASDDDWEVNADLAPNELLPVESLPKVAELSLVNEKLAVPKRRGRGTFSYQKQKLYSDRPLDSSEVDEVVDEDLDRNTGSHSKERQNDYGTRHILVLEGFPPTTKTLELEKLLEDFNSRGVVIRWVNDTTALAVFQTPALAHEALNSIRFPFSAREVIEDDAFLTSISAADLEPPRPRPKTSTRTAQRLIAQGMGLKLPSTSFGSRELRKQEEARKDRIVRRQKLKDDAWGED